MKKKDIVYMVIAVVIFMAAGYIGYTQLMPKKGGAAAQGVEVEKIGKIPDKFDGVAVSVLKDESYVRDFMTPIDFTNLNNTAPFGQ